ncbi:ribokinase [Altererythrobacter atlanticus]|uniref:Ribokinase n=1 Tax=Croceibacterium atlanticum TaxID=1267766 RepID=A0A0F7KPS4_9SPHN|nr:ribokinase [Croceibacterium atlanticum]AKH41131.1 Ribokinase [Croceibacterium atlanticum]MBB5732647.1 ribokinase [Croceibacterium atlanticum]
MAVQVAGSINVDLIQSVELLPRPGETVLALSSSRLPGGKGANQAVAAARMGAATNMIAAIGDDENGQWMRSKLAADNVHVGGIATLPGQATGTAYIAVDRKGENQIIVASGANARLAPLDVEYAAAEADILLAQLEIPIETVLAFFTAPSAESRIRILNAAPARPEASSLFAHTDILIVNEHELAVYLGLDGELSHADRARAARGLISRPDQIVVVTLGAQGALAVRMDDELHVPAAKVTPVDTIGAGDCFTGALAALIDGGLAVADALPLANIAAALCTQQHGAIPAMPTRSDVDRFLAATSEAS